MDQRRRKGSLRSEIHGSAFTKTNSITIASIPKYWHVSQDNTFLTYSSHIEKSSGIRQTEHIFFNLGGMNKSDSTIPFYFPRKLREPSIASPNKTRPQSSASYTSSHGRIRDHFSNYHFARPVAIRRLNVLLSSQCSPGVFRSGPVRTKINGSSVGKSEQTAPGTARSAAQEPNHNSAACSQDFP